MGAWEYASVVVRMPFVGSRTYQGWYRKVHTTRSGCPVHSTLLARACFEKETNLLCHVRMNPLFHLSVLVTCLGSGRRRHWDLAFLVLASRSLLFHEPRLR